MPVIDPRGKKFIQQFKLDFADWEWYEVQLNDCPQSEMEEIKITITDEWQDMEKRTNWMIFVADKAKDARELRDISRGVTDRIKTIAKTHQNALGADK